MPTLNMESPTNHYLLLLLSMELLHKVTIQLQQGTLYFIYCVGSEMCIRQEDQPNDYPGVVASMPCDTDMRQLWYVIGEGDRFEIVNAYSSLAVTEKNGIISLRTPSRKSNQLFRFMKPWSTDNRGVIIRKDNAQSKGICLYGALLYRQIDTNNDNHIFRFQPMKQNVVFERSTTLTNVHTGKVMDIPNFTKKKGEFLVQRNKAQYANLNQHWMFNEFKATPKGYFIQNLFSRMVIDCKKKTRVRHYDFEYYSYQLWYLEKIGDNQFKIHAMDDRTKVLGVKGDDVSESAEIALVGEDHPSGSWYFHGHIPLEFRPEVTENKVVVNKSVMPEPKVSPITVSNIGGPMRMSGMMQPTSILKAPIQRPSEIYPARSALSPSQVVTNNDPRASYLNASIQPSDEYFNQPSSYVRPLPVTLPAKTVHSNNIEVVKMPVQYTEMKMQRVDSFTGASNLKMSTLSPPILSPPILSPPTFLPQPPITLQKTQITKADIPDIKIISPSQQQTRIT